MSEPANTIYKETFIEATPDRVFEAWANPEEIARWYVERAEGDPRNTTRIAWILGGEAEPLAVTSCEPGRRLVLTNVGSEPWKGSVVEIGTEPERNGTRASVAQRNFADALRDHLPNVDAGWECMLAVLKEYVEHHAGEPLRQASSSREFCPANTVEKTEPELRVIAAALASSEAIERWAGELPSRVLASTERGAVLAFAGFPGIFIVMGVGAVSVAYNAWGDSIDLDAATKKANELADRFLAQVLAR